MISKYITHKLRKWWELDSMNILKIETVECLSLCSTTKCQNCLGVSKQQLKLMNIQDICKYMKVNSATIYFRICHNICYTLSLKTKSCCRTYKLALPKVSNEFLPIITTSFACVYNQSNAQGKHHL